MQPSTKLKGKKALLAKREQNIRENKKDLKRVTDFQVKKKVYRTVKCEDEVDCQSRVIYLHTPTVYCSLGIGESWGHRHRPYVYNI